MRIMGEIVIVVPKGLEKIIQRKISLLLRKEEKKGLKKDILKKYLGKFSGSIDEEEWYLQ
ncbi:hypothetical protein [Thermococcus stetteri]|uniref:hypothetical protein n=1 Tax=Thermococcus stetteri TaxID=49900 RepID=UPI001AE94C8E|nr:hypothetical protein [Thermococcus stetteri]MBP1911063.1 hypothetical protein [Thermococcus stetteri]